MSDEQQIYLSYLLRLWQEPVTRQGAWRASLQNSRTGELRGFADIAQLFAFLEQQLAATANTRTRRLADQPFAAYGNFEEGASVQKGVVLPAIEEHEGQQADSAPTTGNPTSDE